MGCKQLKYQNRIFLKVVHRGKQASAEKKSVNPLQYVYNYVDHLGSVRLSYTDADDNGSIDPANEIIEDNAYYPFGLLMRSATSSISPHGNSAAKRWKFNGKELDGTFDIDTYDFGARNFDPSLGRWMNVDPLAEEREWLSPYNFVQNNPINRIDPDGALDESAQGPLTDIWKLFKNEDGTYNAEKQHINDGKNDQIYLVMGDDGVATSMYQGVEAEANMSKDGISISERDNGTTTMSAIKDATVDFWTSDEYRTRNARETMVNYVTSVIPAEGMIVGMLAQTAKVAQGSKWIYGGFKTSSKWANQLAKRGWTETQITQAISKGKSFNAINNVNKANKATRYVHPNTGQSVVIDNVTNELLHVGGKGFKY